MYICSLFAPPPEKVLLTFRVMTENTVEIRILTEEVRVSLLARGAVVPEELIRVNLRRVMQGIEYLEPLEGWLAKIIKPVDLRADPDSSPYNQYLGGSDYHKKPALSISVETSMRCAFLHDASGGKAGALIENHSWEFMLTKLRRAKTDWVGQMLAL